MTSTSTAMPTRLILFLVAALSFAVPADAATGKSSPLPGGDYGPIGLGSMADAMSPLNPFNGGADPVALPGDSRLVVFTYNRDQIFRVLAAPLKVTTIEFPDDEHIVTEPAWGDNVRWEFSTDKVNHLYVKPSASGLVNTLSVNTNKHSYEFTLVSSPLGGIFYQKVRFRVPQPIVATDSAPARNDSFVGGPRNDTVGVAPDKLNFDYSVSGDADYKPDTVFDDGKFVWLRIPKQASEWPVALVKDGSDYVVANFIRRGQFLVVQRMAESIVLRSGKTEVSVNRGQAGSLSWFSH